ncbi:MAG TPA: hypothetical protein VFP59_16310 [Candidatus Angelobacter sp.]|nr:hypothetical protein [Candidatus Angelobacter sp.]
MMHVGVIAGRIVTGINREHCGLLFLLEKYRPIRRPLYGYCTIAANKLKVAENKGVKMVARDGIEPPTPAFSGLRSAISMNEQIRKLLLAVVHNMVDKKQSLQCILMLCGAARAF